MVQGDKDIAASVVPEYAQPWDKEVERRVVRKIDCALIPLMWIGYGLVYYDKVSKWSEREVKYKFNILRGRRPREEHQPSFFITA